MKSNTIITGPVGHGKSYSLRTLLREYPHEGKLLPGAGKEVMLLVLEPGWEATNGDLTCDMGFHVREHYPIEEDETSTITWLNLIKNMGTESIHKFTVPPNIKDKYSDKWIDLYRILGDYTCTRCGTEFGYVAEWDDTRVYAHDGLSGLSTMAKEFTIGPKPHMSWPEFEGSQSYILKYLKKLTGLSCSFVLLAHQSRELDEITGVSSVTLDTIGKALAPQIMKLFDEVVYAYREEGNKYYWSTEFTGMKTKARHLPYAKNMTPTFTHIFQEKEK